MAWEEEHAESQAGLGATAVSFGGLGKERQLLHMSEEEEGALMQVWAALDLGLLQLQRLPPKKNT